MIRRTNISERRWLIIPIETKARELHGKVLLALEAAERGWGVIVGSKSATRSIQEYLPQGMFLEKGIPPGKRSHALIAQEHGHRISALCEEGLLYMDADDYFERRIHTPSFEVLDYFFTWGRRQSEDVISKLSSGTQKVVETGNPRFDVLRPEWRSIYKGRVTKLKEQYGDFILVNTRFARVNHGMGKGTEGSYAKGAGVHTSEKHKEYWHRYLSLEEQLFPYFKELLPLLSKAFPDRTIVVRPHPSEGDASWRESTKNLPNVEVTYGGNVHEWILASSVVINNNCTTGVEAYLLGKPTISYRPVTDEVAELELPNRVGFSVENPQELISLVQALILGEVDVEAQYQEQRPAIEAYIANAGDTPATHNILSALERLDLPQTTARFPLYRGGLFMHILRSLKHLLFGRGLHAYAQKKFPGLSRKEMKGLKGSFTKVSGRFKEVEIVPVARDGFCLFKQDRA